MIKRITPREKQFAKAIAEGYGPADSYRKVYKKPCNPSTPEYQKAMDLAKTARVKRLVEEYREKLEKRGEMEALMGKATPDWDSIYKFAFDRLLWIRDDPSVNAKVRWQAMEVLEKIQDPTQDVNLIWRWVDTIWNGMTAHCPCCHTDFPLWKIKNEALDNWRKENEITAEKPTTDLDRRLHLFSKGEKRKDPRDHEGQLAVLSTPNRHAIIKGPARAGKSFSLAILGFLHLLIPGVEIWLLSRVYDEAEPEFKYLEGFLRTAFYPVDNHMFTRTYDKKTGEAYIETKWGSLIKVKSGKAKGSITGHELEAILVAEPGWVDGDLFEEVRARMSSRLGRIFAFGTPKGFGGFLGRLMRTTTRDMRTGKRLAPGARLIENGCPWSQSIFEYEMKPEQNPEYVTSEIEAARSELTASEFASEFEGRMVGDSNLKFPYITDRILLPITRDKFEDSVFVLGADQGERNFGACLLAWDGEILRVAWEFFDNTEKTIKANLIELNQAVPSMVRVVGGNPESWKLTIFDSDPVIDNQLIELETENRPWKTQYTLKPKNRIETANWREETCLWINEMAKSGKIEFLSEQTDLLHEQLKEALIRDISNDNDTPNKTKKRWVINDPWRGDHVPDAFLMACFTIYSNSVPMESKPSQTFVAFEEQRRAQDYMRIVDERRELGLPVNEDAMFKSVFGRERSGAPILPFGSRGYYSDES